MKIQKVFTICLGLSMLSACQLGDKNLLGAGADAEGAGKTKDPLPVVPPHVDSAPVTQDLALPALNQDTQSTTITLSYADADNDLATACTVNNLSHVTVSQACTCSATSCTLKVTGTSGYYGAASFKYTVTANGVSSNSSTASLTLSPKMVTDHLTYHLDAAKFDGTHPLTAGTLFQTDWFEFVSADPVNWPMYWYSDNGSSYTSAAVGTGTAASPYALHFNGLDGVAGYYDMGGLGGTTVSVELWVNFAHASTTASGLLYDWGNGEWEFGNIDGAGLRFTDSNTGADSGPVPYTTGWTQVVFITGPSGAIYFNGQSKVAANMSINSFFEDPEIGLTWDNNAGVATYFNGDIAMMRVYGKALSAAEIRQNCNTFKSRYSGLTCYTP